MHLSNFEDLAAEILLDIFDYLQPFDLINAFGSLNRRIENLIIHRRIYVDLSSNISFNDFNIYCTKIFLKYSSCIYAIRLSNVETCGAIKLFFSKFPQIEITFPNLSIMSLIEPSEIEYKRIIQLKNLTSIHLKSSTMQEQKIHIGYLFDIPYLKTCTLSYDDVLSISKFRPNPHLNQLVLDSFYINNLHILFQHYPALQHLTINRLIVDFNGFLPPFDQPFGNLRTLKLNCVYTIQFDYIAYLLSFLPQLIRLTIIAIGIGFFNSVRWREVLTSLEKLRFLVFDIKAVSMLFSDRISSSFLTDFWRQWNIAIDYSQDNHKFHLFTVPYRRLSFISTMHCLPIIEMTKNSFTSVTHLYLKTNMPMEIQSRRIYPNVRALQIYENVIVPVNYPALLMHLQSMLYLHKLVHLELFIPLPTSIFLALLKSTPQLRSFKTDYDVLMTVTDRLQDDDVCSQLHEKLEKFVLRRGVLPVNDNNRFLEIFSNLKHLQINLNTIHDLRKIAGKFVKNMMNLVTLNISLVITNEPNDSLQWEGVINNISYEIAKRHIKIWK